MPRERMIHAFSASPDFGLLLRETGGACAANRTGCERHEL
jgi:hypothetical protein